MDAEPVLTSDQSTRSLVRWVVVGLTPSIAAVAAMILCYMLVPAPSGQESAFALICFGVVAMLAYVGLTAFAVRRLRTAHKPVLEGALLLAIMATLLIMSFSWMYLSLAAADPAAFTEPITKISGIYFTVSIISTVGFGDITAKTDLARMTVTAQMLLGITLLTVGVRIVMQSARDARTAALDARLGVGTQNGGQSEP